jgi:hypothetical protein
MNERFFDSVLREGTWAVDPVRYDEAESDLASVIDKLDDMLVQHYAILGDDQYFDQLTSAKQAAEKAREVFKERSTRVEGARYRR